MQFADCLRTVVFHRVCHYNYTEQVLILRKEQRRLAVLREFFCLRLYFPGNSDFFSDKFHAAAEKFPAA